MMIILLQFIHLVKKYLLKFELKDKITQIMCEIWQESSHLDGTSRLFRSKFHFYNRVKKFDWLLDRIFCGQRYEIHLFNNEETVFFSSKSNHTTNVLMLFGTEIVIHFAFIVHYDTIFTRSFRRLFCCPIRI